MAMSRKGGKVQSKIQMLLYGQQGCGKSTICSQMLYLKRPDGKPFRVLYLDPENGSIDDMLDDIENDGVSLDNLYIVYTQSLKEVNEYINKATKKEPFYELDQNGEETDEIVVDADGEQFIPDAVIVDGTTILNLSVKQGLVEFSKKRATVKAKRDNLLGDERFVKIENSGLELKDYNTIGFKGQDLVLTLTGSGLHYIITAREVDEKVSVKGADGQIQSVPTGKKIPEGFKNMGYNVKTEIRLYRDEINQEIVKAFVVKDRTKTFQNGTTVDDPSLFAFQAVIDKTKDNKEVVVQNRLHDAIKKELTETEKEVLGQEQVEETTEDKPQANGISADTLKGEITKIMTTLSPAKKEEVKVKLREANLPDTPSKIKTTNDTTILSQILDTIK